MSPAAGVPVRAIIFDFDGVLADTEALHCTALQSALAEIGLALDRKEYFDRYLGLPDRACVRAVCAAAGRRLDAAAHAHLLARKRACFALVSRTARLYPGAAAAVRRLHRRFLLAIASGAFRDEIEPLLERARIRQLFAAIVAAEDVRAGKPAPDAFLEALHRLNGGDRTPAIAPAECVVIEDSAHGIAAARAAGMRCLAVSTHHGAAGLAQADGIIGHVCRLRAEDLRPWPRTPGV